MHLISPEELTSTIADRLARQSAVLVALDGRCGSGKTTLAAQLTERFPQSITVHTDDFYLPPSRRVTGWEKIPCANMDIQRLRDEVVAPARDSPGWREIEVVGVDGDALRKTLCQLCGQHCFAAAAAAVQCDEDGRLSGQTVGDGRGQLFG